LKAWNVLVSILATLVVLVPFAASLYPIPPYPQNLMIYIFAGLILSGVGWFLFLRIRRPAIVDEIKMHLEDNYDRFAIERAAQSDAAL
jgi:uncharacterized membrane protein